MTGTDFRSSSALTDSQQLLLDALPAEVCVLDAEARIVAVNALWRRLTSEPGLAIETQGMRYVDLHERECGRDPERIQSIEGGIRRVLADEIPQFQLEFPCHVIRAKRWFRLAFAPMKVGENRRGILAIRVDVTARKTAEIELAKSEARLRAIYEHEPECVKIVSRDLTILAMNPAGLRMLGLEREEQVLGRDVLPFVSAPDRSAYLEHHRRACEGVSDWLEFSMVCAEGRQRWMEAHSTRLADPDAGVAVLSVTREVTERKIAEQRLNRLTRLYAVSSSVNEAIVRIREPLELFQIACRIAVEKGGFHFAWVGLARGRKLIPAAQHGVEDGRLEELNFGADEDFSKLGPGARAFRGGAPFWTNNLENSREPFGTRAELSSREHRSCAAFPLKRGGAPFGVFVVYSELPSYFDEQEVALLSALAENLSFAVESHEHERQRREAQEALQLSQANMAIAQRLAHFGSWELQLNNLEDLDANVLTWSDEMYRIAGYEPGEVKVTRAFFFKHVPLEEHALVRDAVASAVRNRSEYAVTHRFIRRDGEQRVLREIGRIFPEEASGALVKIVGTAHDITEQRQAEEALQFQAHLLNVAREAIFVKSLEDRILYWNKGAEKMFGWTAEEAIQQKASELFQTGAQEAEESLAATLARGNWQGEMAHRTKGGHEIIVELGCTLIRDPSGQPKSTLVIASDVTEKKKLETYLLRAQRIDSLGRLAGGIAHDLNNILAPILMCADILQIELREEESKDLLRTMQSNARRASDLVQQVLSFARGGEGKRGPVDVVKVLKDIEKTARDTFPKNVQVTLEADADAWNVIGDKSQIHQVFMNLCVNARDALPRGGLLAIRVRNVMLDEASAQLRGGAPGNYLEVAVRDNGLGIPPEVRERIFDPFFTTKEIGEGTGLGLSTALGIIKSHGGFIAVESEPRRGSIFIVHLPASTHAGEAPIAEAPPADGKGELVLVVDDEENVRKLAEQTLLRAGYKVVCARNGAEAVAAYAARSAEIKVVLLDMVMPVMDGLATIAALKMLDQKVRIIGMSGFAGDPNMTKAAAAKMRQFVPKPFGRSELLRAIRSVIDASGETE